MLPFADYVPAVERFMVQVEGLTGRLYWPGGASGVTGDVGYDFGQHVSTVIASDWAQYLPAAWVVMLQSCAGKTGPDAKAYLDGSAILKNIRIHSDIAMLVFRKALVPRYQALAIANYGEALLACPWQIQWGIFSLTFNRGGIPHPAHIDPNDRWEEEREIVTALAAGNWRAVPDLVRRMKHLWPTQPGLQTRREEEAVFMEGANN